MSERASVQPDITADVRYVRILKQVPDVLQQNFLEREQRNDLQTRMDSLFAEFRAKLDSLVEEHPGAASPTLTAGAFTRGVDSGKRCRKSPGKQFIARDSVLTELFRVSHIRTIYHIFVAMLALLFLHSLLSDLVEHGSLNFGVDLLAFSFGKMRETLELWLAMTLSVILLVYPSFHFWAHHRTASPVVMDAMFGCMLVLYLSLLLVLPPTHVVRNQLPPASAMIVILEQVRWTMKVYAFVRTNLPRARRHHLSTSKTARASCSPSSSSSSDLQAPCPDFNKFMYFLFAPTLVYRDVYPRTDRVRWRLVVVQLLQVLGAIVYTNFLLRRFLLAPFKQLGLQPMTASQLLVNMISLVVPAMFCYLSGFFALLHAWMNAFAEMTRFADRLFYRDWWNMTNFAGFYRTWNIVVHDWLYEYIYLDMQTVCGKLVATLAVFAVSAVVHEYVLMVVFGFFFPLLFLQFGFFGTCMYFFNLRNGSGNILLWTMLSLGNALNFCFYTAEWYARANCPAVHEDIFMNFLSSRVWTCTVANGTMIS